VRALVGLAVVALAPAAVAAEPSVPDTVVTTRGGAVYQGVLVENVPGDHVTIQSADGKIHSFPSAGVAAIRGVGAGRPPVPAPADARSPNVLVDLSSADPGARLVQMSVSGGGVAAPNPEICGPPCGVRVAPGNYVVAGNGILPSPLFELPESAGHVRVSAETVTYDQRTTGIILSAGGGITAASVGLPLWLMGAAMEDFEGNSSFDGPGSSGSTIKWAGIVTTAVCVAAAIVGLVVYHGGTTARVDRASR
jgi:hypothetical protein